MVRALWLPRLDLKTAAAARIYAGGAHHTGFSFAVVSGHLRDFAEIAGLEFLLIDENTRMEDSKHQLCWNEVVYHKGLELSWTRYG